MILIISLRARDGPGFLRKLARTMKKKLYGYFACLIILTALVDPNSFVFPETEAQTHLVSKKSSDYTHKRSDFSSISNETISKNKIYFVGEKKMQVETTDRGWVVELMYGAQKKETQTKR